MTRKVNVQVLQAPIADHIAHVDAKVDGLVLGWYRLSKE
jgi:hypothetical protein